MEPEQVMAELLISEYRTLQPGLLNSISKLKAHGRTPKQIESLTLRQGATKFTANNIFLIAKYLKVEAKEKSN